VRLWMVLLTAPLWAQTARESALGEAMAKELRRSSQAVTAPQFDAYLQALGGRIGGYGWKPCIRRRSANQSRCPMGA
jgi:hypothetical protein